MTSAMSTAMTTMQVWRSTTPEQMRSGLCPQHEGVVAARGGVSDQGVLVCVRIPHCAGGASRRAVPRPRIPKATSSVAANPLARRLSRTI